MGEEEDSIFRHIFELKTEISEIKNKKYSFNLWLKK